LEVVVNTVRLIGCLAALWLLAGARPALAQQSDEGPDAIYLSSGQVVRGTVVDDAPEARTVVLRTKDGRYIRFQRSEILRIVRGDQRTGVSAHVVARDRKSPPLAWALSFALPGAGQVYNGQAKKAGAFGSLVAFGTAMALGAHSDCETYEFECGIRTVGIAVVAAAWAGSQLDAVLSARAINRQRAIDLQIGVAPHPLGVSVLSLRF
jgi:hypothetical protein